MSCNPYQSPEEIVRAELVDQPKDRWWVAYMIAAVVMSAAIPLELGMILIVPVTAALIIYELSRSWLRG